MVFNLEKNIASIGIDIEEVARIEAWRSTYSWDILQIVFTSSEWAQVVEENISLAIFFSAKEAVVKALGTGFGGIYLNEIEIKVAPHRFDFALTGSAKKLMEMQNLVIQQGLWTMEKGIVLSFASFGSYGTIRKTS